MQGVEPGIEFVAAFFETEAGVVGNVIAAAHKGVDRAQRLPLALGKNQECVIEILGVAASDAAAHRLRHAELRRSWTPRNHHLLRSRAHTNFPTDFPISFPNAARATRASLRGFEITGRQPSTAKFWCSMAFRISWPPRLKSSMSTASSLSTLLTSGRPRSNHWRARAAFKFIIA